MKITAAGHYISNRFTVDGEINRGTFGGTADKLCKRHS